MNIRPKTLRRLLILFATTAVVAAVITSWLLLAQHRLARKTAALRGDAIAAYGTGKQAEANQKPGKLMTGF